MNRLVIQVVFKCIEVRNNDMRCRVVIPLCGGNIDTTVLGRCLERGLAADGRLCRFVVTVSDRPGGIAELTKHLANLGVRYIIHLVK